MRIMSVPGAYVEVSQREEIQESAILMEGRWMRRKTALAFGLMALGIVAAGVLYSHGNAGTVSVASNWNADELLLQAETKTIGLSDKCQEALNNGQQKVEEKVQEILAPLKKTAKEKCLEKAGRFKRTKCFAARKAYERAVRKFKERIERKCVAQQSEAVCWLERTTCIPKSCEDEKDAVIDSAKKRKQQGKECNT